MGKKRGNKKNSNEDSVNKKSEEYQVIIIVDDVDSHISVSDKSIPTCLMKVAGTPILDYVIHSVDNKKLTDILLLTYHYREAVENYIENLDTKLEINIYSPEAYNFGDWMREIKSYPKLKDNFVLLRGNCFCNFDIENLIKKYEEARKRSKAVIMLKAFAKHSTLDHRRNTKDNTFLFVDQDNVVRLFENAGNSSQFKMMQNIRVKFKYIQGMKLIYDLYDTKIAVCHQNYLNYFYENYDYKNERDQFIRDLMCSEVSLEEIAYHELSHTEYVRRIRTDWDLWKANQDCIRNFISPMLIYNPSHVEKFVNTSSYIKSGGINSFVSKLSKIEHKVKINRNCLIDEGVSISENSLIKNSIIGANVHIGSGVKIIDSLILSDTVIGDNVQVVQSFLGKSVKIGSGSILKNSEIECEVEIPEGKNVEFLRQGKTSNLQIEDISDFHNTLKGEKDDLIFPGETEEIKEIIAVDFDKEIKETILRGLMENHDCQDIIREITSLKLTENKTFVDCINSSMRVILKDIADSTEDKEGNEIVKVIKDKLEFWEEFFEKFCVSLEEETLVLVDSIEAGCKEYEKLHIQLFLQILFKENILEDRVIIKWYDETSKKGDDWSQDAVAKCKQFIEWLQASSEEEASDSDSGSNSGSDSKSDDSDSSGDED